MKRRRKFPGATRGVMPPSVRRARLLPHLPEPSTRTKRTIHLLVVAVIAFLLMREEASAADWSFVALSVIVEII